MQDALKDGLRAGVSFVIALVLLGAALWYDVDLTSVLDLNIAAIKAVTSLLAPFELSRQTEFLLRAFGMEKILFFTELWAFVALALRAVGLGFRVVRKGMYASSAIAKRIKKRRI